MQILLTNRTANLPKYHKTTWSGQKLVFADLKFYVDQAGSNSAENYATGGFNMKTIWPRIGLVAAHQVFLVPSTTHGEATQAFSVRFDAQTQKLSLWRNETVAAEKANNDSMQYVTLKLMILGV